MKLMDKKEKTRSYASLSLYSRVLSVEELTQLVGIPPDDVKQKGTPVARSPSPVYRHSVISFESRVDQSADPSAHLEDLLSWLGPAKDRLRAFAEPACVEEPELRTPVSMTVVIETRRSETGFEFSNELLKAISDFGSDLGVEVDFDDEPSDEEIETWAT